MKNLKSSLSNYFNEYKPLINNSRLIRIIIAGIISSFGSKISYFALLRKVYIISNGKITDLGFLTIFEILPSIFFSVFAGYIIDKVPRKWIMIISDISSGIAILSAIYVNDLKYIYIIAFIKATVNVFRLPAQSAFEPNLVDKEDIPLLNSFKSSTNSIIQMIGSALGAATVGFLGVKYAFIADALTFWASALIILSIMITESHLSKTNNTKEKVQPTKEFIEGASIMWRHPKIRLMVSIEAFLTFAMSMQGTLIYVFIRETLKMGDMAEVAWGTLLSALGVGSLIGSFYIGVKVKGYPNPFKLFLNVLLFDSLIFTLFVFNKYFPLSIFLFALLGFVGAAHMIILNSVLQRTVPDENRGKVFSLLNMINSPISILSILFGTTLASLITAQMVLFMAASLEALIAIGVRFTKVFKNVENEVNIDIIT